LRRSRVCSVTSSAARAGGTDVSATEARKPPRSRWAGDHTPAGPPASGTAPGALPKRKVKWRLRTFTSGFVQLSVGCIQDSWHVGKIRLFWRGKFIGKAQPFCNVETRRATAEIILRSVTIKGRFILSSDLARKIKYAKRLRLRAVARVDGKDYSTTLRLRRGRILNRPIAVPAGTFPGLTYWSRRYNGRSGCVGCWWYYFWSWIPAQRAWLMRVQEAETNENSSAFTGLFYIEWAHHFYVYVQYEGTGVWQGAYGPYDESAWPN
jgi:hypothetical protein